jgi:uncharacterized lipoprotein NlpE involved in copper resistance
MQKTVFILCLVIATLFGCNGRKMTSQLEAISKIADSNPDSALTALAKYENEKQEWSKGDRMHFELVRLKAENKSEVTFKSDSIIKEVVEYFKEKGNANEKMLAYYLLGRTYFDMEEAPEALQAYYDAISSADTTSTSCDYSTLTVVYGQMSRIFHQQNLPHDEIWALKHYIEYIRRYESKKDYLIAKEQLIRPLYLLNEKDSVLQIINDTYSALKQMGEHQEAADAIAVSTYIYLERGELDEAKHAMDIFEKESGLFDKYGNITEGREHYYYTKGFYELAVNRLDSAEYYFRKAIKYGYLSDGYKGLLSIYREKQNIDSVNYFSRQYEAAQDSLHNKIQTDAIHQMSALYNYSRSQKEAEQEKEKAQDRLYLLSIISFATIILLMAVIVVAWLYRKNQKEKKARIAELEETLNSARLQRNTILEELRILKEKDYESIIAIKEKQEQELTKRIEILEAENMKNKNTDAINRIDHLDNFLDSAIAQQFVKKATDKSERIKPTESEWNLLTSQFSKDIPVTYKSFGQGKPLSQLEQRICILLILDIPEKVISLMTDSYASTISNAKARANEKLYGKKDAHSLRNNLINGLKRS